MAEPSLRDRLTAIVGTDKVERVIDLLDEEAVTRCRDDDCVRRRAHSRLDRHLWRHTAGAPLTRGLFGWLCFNCGRSTWRRIHRTGPTS